MSMIITSTTDSAEAVAAAMAEPVKVVVEEKSAVAPGKEAAEKFEASEASNEEEVESEESEEGEEESSEVKPTKKSGIQKRFDKLTKQKAQLNQEKEYWRQEALKHQNPAAEKPTEVVAKPIEGNAKPDREKFDTHEDYVEALTDWKVDQKLIASKREDQAKKIKAEQEESGKTFKAKVDAFKETHEDYDELLEAIDDIPVSQGLGQALLESENTPELMYALAKNREEYERINKLSPLLAAKELGKFEAKFIKPSDLKETKEVKATKAPAPITPIGGKGTGSGKKSLDDPNLSQREYDKLRDEQEAKRAKSAW